MLVLAIIGARTMASEKAARDLAPATEAAMHRSRPLASSRSAESGVLSMRPRQQPEAECQHQEEADQRPLRQG